MPEPPARPVVSVSRNAHFVGRRALWGSRPKWGQAGHAVAPAGRKCRWNRDAGAAPTPGGFRNAPAATVETSSPLRPVLDEISRRAERFTPVCRRRQPASRDRQTCGQCARSAASGRRVVPGYRAKLLRRFFAYYSATAKRTRIMWWSAEPERAAQAARSASRSSTRCMRAIERPAARSPGSRQERGST